MKNLSEAVSFDIESPGKLKELKAIAHNIRLLYAEDDSTIVKPMLIFLNKIFKEVVHAKDGALGLATYKTSPFDLVITDIFMPNMNGIEMSRQIRLINPNQHILVISAHSDTSYLISSITLGLDGYILKPINYNLLINELFRTVTKINEHTQNIEYRKHLQTMVKKQTEALRDEYITDELTGLYNRIRLKEILAEGKPHSLLILNIDNFGIINDSYGMRYGDKILFSVAQMLGEFKKEGIELFRIGGDEFVVLLPHDNAKKAKTFAEDIKSYFQNYPITFRDVSIKIGFTIGIAAGKGYELLRHASVSLRIIRESGKNLINIYDASTGYEEKQRENIDWIGRIKKALLEKRFEPYFQPIYDNQTAKAEKYESLARMKEGGEIISPYFFLGPARVSGLLTHITMQIVEKSCERFSQNNKNFSVNITDQDLREKHFERFLYEQTDRYKISPSRLTLEILESISLHNEVEIIQKIKSLKAFGFRLAIDDFGIQNSNFSRLMELDVDFIKIDGSFIKNLDSNVKSQKITESIVALGKSIQAETVAEFVHNESISQKVREYEIDYSQGYFFSEPLRDPC